MAGEVVWLRAALDDLDEIAAYIAQNSPAYAATVVSKIQAAARDLEMFPLMGPRVPEWDSDDLRQQVVYRYRLIYRVKPGRIEILAVIHGARQLPGNILRR